MSVFLNVDDIVSIIDGCRKFQPAQMNLVEFIFMCICNNCQQVLIQKVYLKSGYVKLCERFLLANYDITISPLPIRNTGYAEVPLRVYG